MASSLTQHSYELFEDNDALNPTVSKTAGNENTRAGGIAAAEVVRIRLGLKNEGDATQTANSFQIKLQYGESGTGNSYTQPSAIGTWTDVGASGSGSIWRYHNTAATDGATLTTQLLSDGNVFGLLVESAPSGENPNAIGINGVVEYDFPIERNGATDGTYYAFRAVFANNATLPGGYTEYPFMANRNDISGQEQHQWLHVSQANVALTGEDTTLSNVTTGQICYMRLMHKDGGDYLTGADFDLFYYNNYTDFDNGTNGTRLGDVGPSGVVEWEWYDEGTAHWHDHSLEIPDIKSSDHNPGFGYCMEERVNNGDSWLLDWTAVGNNSGPEHNIAMKYLGNEPTGNIYYFRVEIHGTQLPLSNMHYGTNKDVFFEVEFVTPSVEINCPYIGFSTHSSNNASGAAPFCE